jgi:hypothetical protein
MERRYYYRDSSGEDTNLQLYSLKQAKLQWADLEGDLEQGNTSELIHEKCVFLICTMGLSVSQLLGQNNPAPEDHVPSPSKLFSAFVDYYSLDQGLKVQFKKFIEVYDHCRHFGLTNQGRRHYEVSQVTPETARDHYLFGLSVWELVIEVFRKDPRNHLRDLDLSTVEAE